MSDKTYAFIFVVVFLGGTFFGLIVGKSSAIIDMKKKAVAVGAAEYVLDPKNGTVTWRWKTK